MSQMTMESAWLCSRYKMAQPYVTDPNLTVVIDKIIESMIVISSWKHVARNICFTYSIPYQNFCAFMKNVYFLSVYAICISFITTVVF